MARANSRVKIWETAALYHGVGCSLYLQGCVPFQTKADSAFVGNRGSGRSEPFQDFVQEEFLRKRPFHGACFIDHSLRYRVHPVSAGEVRELRGLNTVRLDQLALQGEAVSQAHGLRTVGSGGGDEDLEVHGLGDLRKLLPVFGLQSGIALGDAEDSVEEGSELISGR